MAEARYRVYNEDGSVQMSNETFALGLVSTGSLDMVDDGYNHPQPMIVGSITVTNAVNPIIAFLPSASNVEINQTSISNHGNGQFKFQYRAKSNNPASFKYWVFDVAEKAMKDAALTNAGIKLYDSTGVLTYHAAMPVLRIQDYVALNMPPNNGPGQSIQNVTQTVIVPQGRTYGVIPSFGAYVSTMWNGGNYSSEPGGGGIMYPDPGAAGPGPNVQYKDMHLEAAHSTAAVDANGNLRVGLTNFEHWWGWYSVQEVESYNEYGQLGFAIVDLTDFVESGGGGTTGLTVNVNATSRTVSGAPGQTTITTAVTATPSGGTAPYSYSWALVSGSTIVTSYSSTATTASLRTQVASQAGGTSYTSIWRCRVQDSSGKVGYSPNVTFTHTTVAVDQTLDPISWSNISTTTTETNHRLRTGFSNVSGVNVAVNLRATVSNFTKTGSITSHRLECYEDGNEGSLTGHSTTLNNGAWAQTTAKASGSVQWVSHVVGTGSVSYTVTVTNVQTGAVVAIFSVNHTTGQLTYNVDAISWPNISNMSGTSSVSNNQPWRNITGNTGNVVLKATVSNVTRASTVTSSRLEIRINNSDTAHATTSGTNLANGSSCQTTGNMVGGSIRISVFAGGTGTISYTVTLTNVTTGAVVSTFTVSHGVNIEDKTPDAISYPGFNGTSNDPDAWFTGVPVTIKGINRDITIRVERYNYSGNMDACYVDVFTKATSATEWTHRGYFEAHQADYRYLDIVVSNNTDIRWDVHGVTNSGRRTATMDFCLWNLGVAPNVQLIRVNGNTFAVDNDNNYNIPDYVPNTITISNVSTTNNSQNVTVDRSFTVGGINREVTLRFNITNVSGNADTRNLLIYKNNVLQHTLAATANRNASVTVVNGDVIKLTHNASTTYRKKTANWTTTIYNLSSGTTQLVQYTVALSADNDDNYQRVTYTGGGNISESTNNPSIETGWRYLTLGGFTGSRTIRVTRSAASNTGNITDNVMDIAVSPDGASGWVFSTLNPGNIGDYPMQPGYVFGYRLRAATSARKATTSSTLTFRDNTNAVNFYTATVAVTVDADDNHTGVQPLSVSVSPTYLDPGWEYVQRGRQHSQYLGRANVLIAGGTGPYTQVWERTSGTSGFTAQGYTTYAEFFYSGRTNYSADGSFRLKVTDSKGAVVYSDIIGLHAEAGDIQN